MTDKISLRRGAKLRRDSLSPEERAARSLAAAIRLDELAAGLGPGAVAAFISFQQEIDTTPVIDRLARRGLTVLLPRVGGKGQPLAFHAYRRGDPLLPSRFGVLEPTPMAPRLDPQILLIPLLAFDPAGRRLGYGAGHYDRSLHDLRARRRVIAIGYAFAVQEEPVLPEEAHDQRLDWVVTDEGARACA